MNRNSLTPRLSVMSLLLIPLSSVELPLVQQPGSAVVIIADSEGRQVRIGDAFRRHRGFIMKRLTSRSIEHLEITGIQVVHTGVAACPATEDDICRLVESIARGLPRRDVIGAIIDTGITTEHPEFHGKLLEGYDASGEDENSVQDRAGHGTKVAGVMAANINDGLGIAGVADKVKIRPVKVTQRNYSTFGDAQLARGWEAALNFQDIDMIVYAAGGDHTPDKEALFMRLLTKTVEKGVIVLTGSKNSDEVSTEAELALPCSLANQFPGVLCAAATTATNPKVLAYAASRHASFGLLGTEVWSPTHKCLNGGCVYGSLGGASMATAIAAGVVALMQSFENFTPAKIDRMLIGATEGRVKTVNGTEMDYGSLRPDLAVRKAIAEAAPPPRPGIVNSLGRLLISIGEHGRANPLSSSLHVSMSMAMLELFWDGLTSLPYVASISWGVGR
ncbi:hypothetical protein FOZ60_013495 [Perkinsus olseni]|uniref:subtilisin n=1 Tax=Perkinsus olseni TaxID=32597 RepID=A0A7J6PAK1_PEROL|nr:hypothetical protein FOZ60_013495 [Perkinsus olseni]